MLGFLDIDVVGGRMREVRVRLDNSVGVLYVILKSLYFIFRIIGNFWRIIGGKYVNWE